MLLRAGDMPKDERGYPKLDASLPYPDGTHELLGYPAIVLCGRAVGWGVGNFDQHTLGILDHRAEMADVAAVIAHQPFEVVQVDIVIVARGRILGCDEIGSIDETARSEAESADRHKEVVTLKADLFRRLIDRLSRHILK